MQGGKPILENLKTLEFGHFPLKKTKKKIIKNPLNIGY
jgi:hypothetical protein